MKTTAVTPEDLQGVFAVPPLARKDDPARSLDLEQNAALVKHMAAGGLSRFLYGGNAFLYHVTLAEYGELLDWLSGLDGWAIPSLGPSFGRAIDQAPLLRRHRFPTAMALPCGDPRDARGMETGAEGAAPASTNGTEIEKAEPWPGADLTEIGWSRSRAMRATIGSPSPRPCDRSRSGLLIWKKSSNTACCFSRGMPIPVSTTARFNRSPERRQPSRIPPRDV